MYTRNRCGEKSVWCVSYNRVLRRKLAPYARSLTNQTATGRPAKKSRFTSAPESINNARRVQHIDTATGSTYQRTHAFAMQYPCYRKDMLIGYNATCNRVCSSSVITVQHVRQMLGLEHLEHSCQTMYSRSIVTPLPTITSRERHVIPMISTKKGPHQQIPSKQKKPSAIDRRNAPAIGISHTSIHSMVSTPLQLPPVRCAR